MRTLLPKKERYYKDYADVVFKTARQLRYGISSCKSSVVDPLLASIRKELVDWQSNEDEDALCQTNVTTWLPVNYRNDNTVQYDMTQNSWGAGYYNSASYRGPQTTGIGFAAGDASGNIIEVNTGGCITRINLNPAITINTGGAQYSFHQSTPATVWTITHNLGFIPNVFIMDDNGVEIIGVIESATTAQLVISFTDPVTGYAYLS